MFVSFSQHSAKLKFKSDHIAFKNLYSEEQFEQELEQENLNLSGAGGYFAGKKSQFSLLCISWICKTAITGNGKSVQQV